MSFRKLKNEHGKNGYELVEHIIQIGAAFPVIRLFTNRGWESTRSVGELGIQFQSTKLEFRYNRLKMTIS